MTTDHHHTACTPPGTLRSRRSPVAGTTGSGPPSSRRARDAAGPDSGRPPLHVRHGTAQHEHGGVLMISARLAQAANAAVESGGRSLIAVSEIVDRRVGRAPCPAGRGAHQDQTIFILVR